VTQDILIVGGYGVVGSRIARELAPEYAGRLIIAGRSAEHAQSAALLIGHGARARTINIEDPASIAAALEGVAVAVNCIDQPRRLLLSAVLERGLRYTDITPHLVQLGRGAAFEKIDAEARASGARVILGTGIVPGISNVVVRALADALGGADEIETSLLLDATDISGPASLAYFLQELAMSFDVHIDGADLRKNAFSEPRLVEYPPPVGPRLSYLFPFSDQVLYPRTLGARTVITRLALDPPWLARTLSLLAQTGASRLLAGEFIRRIAARGRHDRPGPGAPFALRVDVRHGGRSRYATLAGQTQAKAAALGAAGVARALADGQVQRPGAWMPDQVIEPAPFLAWLAAHGMKVDFPAG
jgi:saccharopine dehydrogenase-like NADP-dependent oxidoreductase